MTSQFHFFPWREEESLLSRKKILRPTVDVQLSCGSHRTRFNALIDTGAPVTVFPRGTGDLLNLEFPDDEWGPGEDKVILMGNEYECIVRTVSLLLPPFEDLGWEAPVRFALTEGLPFGLLGYEGFLEPLGCQL